MSVIDIVITHDVSSGDVITTSRRGWSQYVPSKSRWRTAASVKTTVKSPYLRNCYTDFDEIWHGDAHWPLKHVCPLKYRIFENP